MRYCGHFLIKAEGGAKNYEPDHPLPLSWRPFTVVFLQRKGYASRGVVRGEFVPHSAQVEQLVQRNSATLD